MNPGVARDADFLEDGPEHIECILNRHFEESNVQVVAYDPEHGGFGVVTTITIKFCFLFLEVTFYR